MYIRMYVCMNTHTHTHTEGRGSPKENRDLEERGSSFWCPTAVRPGCTRTSHSGTAPVFFLLGIISLSINSYSFFVTFLLFDFCSFVTLYQVVRPPSHARIHARAHTHTEREREREREPHTHACMHAYIHTYIHTYIYIYMGRQLAGRSCTRRAHSRGVAD